MFKEKLTAIRQELASYSSGERMFIFSAMLCGFLICAQYAIVRPVSNSLFIGAYGADFFPYAWLATLPLNLALVALYNRFLPRLGCFKMFLALIALVAGSNLFSAFFLDQVRVLPFVFYIWKEVYVMLLFQQLWSVIHSTMTVSRAKYLYGILFAVGGVGGTVGSMIPGFLAVQVGSEQLLLFSLPICLLMVFAYYKLLANGSHPEVQTAKKPSFSEGFQLIARSRFLTFILLIVVLMQISSTLVEYQFNTILEQTVPGKDLRTEYTGKILVLVNFITTGFQLFGTFLLVHFLGLRWSHFAVPFTLCLNAIAFLFFPVFGVATFSYISIKIFDFSIFNVIKEMLYIPLKVEEKFQAKAVIDVFAYRSAKALASILIALIPFTFLAWGGVVLFLLWALVISGLFREHQRLTT
jgi:AAA family ATP:ADP antiporter